jgi:hypothetical protein
MNIVIISQKSATVVLGEMIQDSFYTMLIPRMIPETANKKMNSIVIKVDNDGSPGRVMKVAPWAK